MHERGTHEEGTAGALSRRASFWAESFFPKL